MVRESRPLHSVPGGQGLSLRTTARALGAPHMCGGPWRPRENLQVGEPAGPPTRSSPGSSPGSDHGPTRWEYRARRPGLAG